MAGGCPSLTSEVTAKGSNPASTSRLRWARRRRAWPPSPRVNDTFVHVGSMSVTTTGRPAAWRRPPTSLVVTCFLASAVAGNEWRAASIAACSPPPAVVAVVALSLEVLLVPPSLAVVDGSAPPTAEALEPSSPPADEALLPPSFPPPHAPRTAHALP